MSRRANGEGTIRKRLNGKWEGRYYDKNLQKQISLYADTKIEVIKKIQYAQCMQGDSKFLNNNDILLEVWARIWLENYTAHLKSLTITSYRNIIKNHINPILGQITLPELTTEQIQNLYKEKSKTLSPKTLHNIHGCLHKCLQQAVNLGSYRIHKNPADNCSLPRVEDYEYEVLEDCDVGKLLENINIEDIYDQISIVGLFTGMRQSEILGLRWKDVDFKSKTIHICRQLQKDNIVHNDYGSKYFIGTSPKGNKGRTIEMPDFVVQILQLRKQQQEEDKMASIDEWCGDLKINLGLIFTHPNGQHLAHVTVLKKYKKMLERCELTETRFHDLRHSYAVISLTIGENIKTVQFNMGHYSAAFMLKKYGHVTQGMKHNNAYLLQQYINEQLQENMQEDKKLG